MTTQNEGAGLVERLAMLAEHLESLDTGSGEAKLLREAITAITPVAMVEKRAREILALTLEKRGQSALARAVRRDPVYAIGVLAEDAIAAILIAFSEASCAGSAEAIATREMATKKYEYQWRAVTRCAKNSHIMPALNEFGQDGWEVFFVEPTINKDDDDIYGVWMRRPLPQQAGEPGEVTEAQIDAAQELRRAQIRLANLENAL